MKKQNEGVRAYQEARRQETLSKVDDAYRYLKETNQIVTKTALSKESGVALRTLQKEYVQVHLLRYPEFNPNIASENATEEIENLKNECVRLKTLLSKARNDNNRLKAEMATLKEKNKELITQNERLAGAYQKVTEKKLIRL